MLSLRNVTLASLYVLSCYAQSSLIPVPTGTPIPGNYTGALRPQVHYSPPKGFMNDPNGMFVDADGVWHLYYQYNPTGIVAGNQHWGHATSKDLYHWVNQPIALFPVNSSAFIYSGSAVIDVNNTSGFFPSQNNGVVAIYTVATLAPISLQSQNIAYSRDGGYTFTVYDGNPVLDVGSSQFRDPKVIWYQSHWVMVVTYASKYAIGFFTSMDLKSWTHASNFSYHGLLGIQWECPNLVEVPVVGTSETKWLLQISINPGAPLGGSIAQYYPGAFDGYRFTPVDGVARIADWGKDNYAGQFFYGTPAGDAAVSIAWASNWQYAQTVPTGPSEGFRSVMSLPRRNALKRVGGVDWALVSLPYNLSPVMGRRLVSRQLGNGSVSADFASVYSKAIYFEATTTNALAGTLNFTFFSPISAESFQGGIFFGAAQPVFINRGGIRGFDNVFFTDKVSKTTLEGVTKIEGVIDRSIFEFFLNGGESSSTTTFFATEPLTLVTMAVAGVPANSTTSIKIYELKSAWKGYENGAGVVVGNATA